MRKSLTVIASLLLLAGCSDPVAEVDGREISKESFRKYLEYKNVPPSNAAQAQKVLEGYARREAMAEAIADTDALDMERIEIEVNEFRKQTLISRYFEQFLKDKVDDAAISNYYAAHAEQYQARKAHLAHILFRVRPGMSEQERAAQLTAAREALSRINKGEDFAAVATAVSEDDLSAARGGDLGWMKEGAVSEGFSQAAFALEPGEVSEVVNTTFGFHIIKLIEGPEVVRQPLEAVRGEIRYLLRQQAKNAEAERLLEAVDVEVAEWKE